MTVQIECHPTSLDVKKRKKSVHSVTVKRNVSFIKKSLLKVFQVVYPTMMAWICTKIK